MKPEIITFNKINKICDIGYKMDYIFCSYRRFLHLKNRFKYDKIIITRFEQDLLFRVSLLHLIIQRRLLNKIPLNLFKKLNPNEQTSILLGLLNSSGQLSKTIQTKNEIK